MNRYLRWMAPVIAAYIVLALIWWSILLFRKTEDLFLADLRLREMVDRHQVPNSGHLPPAGEIRARYRRQRLMIVGESLFILGSTMFGIGLVFRFYVREQRILNQRRNFLLSVTHELKTPVTAMRLALETIRKRPLTADQTRQLTGASIREADRLTDTVNNLLLAARMDGLYLPASESRTLAETTGTWRTLWQTHWPERTLAIDLRSDDRTEVTTDWPGLDIIFRNLAENAVKYSPPDQPVEVSLAVRDRKLEVECKDSGPGIPPAERRRVFDLFYRGGSEETRSKTGTGLGLYLVREIVLRNRGQIRLTGNFPSGTRFQFSIPLA